MKIRLCVMLMLLLLLLVILFLTPKPRIIASFGQDQRPTCPVALQQIGQGLAVYTENFGFEWDSPEMQCLYDRGQGVVPDRRCFICPVREELHPQANSNGDWRCDYLLKPDLQPDDPVTTVVACDKPGNHPDGGCLLYKDYHVRVVYGIRPEQYARWCAAWLAGDPLAAFGPDHWRKESSAAAPAPAEVTPSNLTQPETPTDGSE